MSHVAREEFNSEVKYNTRERKSAQSTVIKLTDSSVWLSMREQTRKSSRYSHEGRRAARSQLPEAKPEATAGLLYGDGPFIRPVATRTRNPRPLVLPITLLASRTRPLNYGLYY